MNVIPIMPDRRSAIALLLVRVLLSETVHGDGGVDRADGDGDGDGEGDVSISKLCELSEA